MELWEGVCEGVCVSGGGGDVRARENYRQRLGMNLRSDDLEL